MLDNPQRRFILGPMEATEVKRCGRCLTVLTPDELSNQRYPDHLRCGACDCLMGIKAFLDFSSIPACTVEEAKTEWLRRIFFSGFEEGDSPPRAEVR